MIGFCTTIFDWNCFGKSLPLSRLVGVDSLVSLTLLTRPLTYLYCLLSEYWRHKLNTICSVYFQDADRRLEIISIIDRQQKLFILATKFVHFGPLNVTNWNFK